MEVEVPYIFTSFTFLFILFFIFSNSMSNLSLPSYLVWWKTLTMSLSINFLSGFFKNHSPKILCNVKSLCRSETIWLIESSVHSETQVPAENQSFPATWLFKTSYSLLRLRCGNSCKLSRLPPNSKFITEGFQLLVFATPWKKTTGLLYI